jgi:hypothetical protein
VQEKLIHPYQRGYTETIKVATTKSGKRHFLFQGQRYLIEEDSLHRAHFQVGDTFAEFHQVSQGLSTKVAELRLETLGPNEVPFRPEPFWKSIVEEMFTLFKVYQFLIYSIWLWFAYLFVGALLFSIVLIAAAITIFNRRRSQFAIAKVRHRSMQIPQDMSHVDLCLMRHRDIQIQQVPHVELCLMRHTERDTERERESCLHMRFVCS